MSNHEKSIVHAAASVGVYLLCTGGSAALSLGLLSLFHRPPLALLPVAAALVGGGIWLSCKLMDALDEWYRLW